MDKNNIIGFTLIMILIIIWANINAPTEEEIRRQEEIRDSVLNVEKEQELADKPPVDTAAMPDSARLQDDVKREADSVKLALQRSAYGPFAQASIGEEKTTVLENDKFVIKFSNKGGRIKEVILKNYNKILLNEKHEETKIPLSLLEDEKNKFEYIIPLENAGLESINTGDLYFQKERTDQGITYFVSLPGGMRIEQVYRIKEDSYELDYVFRTEGMNPLVPDEETIALNWVNYLDKLELNTQYERNYSSIYYKVVDEDTDYCSCTGDDEEDADNEPLKWIAHSNQFFHTALIGSTPFKSGLLETEIMEEDAEELKKLRSVLQLPYEQVSSDGFDMKLYIGPKEFERLAAYGIGLEDSVPFGWSIFGTINRWVIRPLFGFLSRFFGSYGIVILALTLLVKFAMFPLTYKMLYSQSKMGALKPQMAEVKEKYKDDPQAQQMETMKMYREFGVNPLGGCLPMVLQMPIWFALYRFFPASIEFRQASFLWASDLSSYDVFVYLPFEIPFYGAHVSLFTLLWAGTTVLYTWYNTRIVDMAAANPMMKYMQYGMPIMFLFFFNNFASGLTCYLFFSNVINIGQTVITKNYIIDQDKIREKLERNKAKPKKKGKFQQRLEQAMKEQQKIAAERDKKKKKGKK